MSRQGHAASLVMHEPDARGWQIIVPYNVPSKAIHAVREVPPVMGWRYFPNSHVEGPWKCLCEYCLSGVAGGIKSRKRAVRLSRKIGAEQLNIERDAASFLNVRKRR